MKKFNYYKPYFKRFGVLGLIQVLVILISIIGTILGDIANISVIVWVFVAMQYRHYNEYVKFDFYDPIKPAMNVLYKREARSYLNNYTIYLMYHHKYNIEQAHKLIRENIGYFAGYYDLETAERMERLFEAIHPVLGTVAERRNMTSQEIFELGKKHAKVHLKP